MIGTRIIKNVVFLPGFSFPSDHRMVRSTIKIGVRARYLNYNKRSKKITKNIIPVHKQSLANEQMTKQLDLEKVNWTKENFQNHYNKLEESIINIKEKFGREKEPIKTDDKLTERTKKLIKERN